MISQKFFYELKYSTTNNEYGNYVFENPFDNRYVHDVFFDSYGPGFLTGGQSKDHTVRKTLDKTLKIDATWQLNNNHSFLHY